MTCHHEDLGLEELERADQAAVAAGHMTAEQAAAVTKTVKSARQIARDTIVRLEPRHIGGFPSLIVILETALKEARAQQWISEIRDKPQATSGEKVS